MLVNLHVRNMALIEEADIDLTAGLNILTGETGAGKSIIIGSVNAALGGRISADMIRKGSDYALVELVFHVEDEKCLSQLEELDIPDLEDKDIVISRKIMPSRSVQKVNGGTVTVSQLRKIAGLLIDIHGQHEHQSLFDEERHLEITDRFLGEGGADIKLRLEKEFDRYQKLKKEYEEFDIDEEQKNREIALLCHETEEINNAGLVPGEDEELEYAFKRMNNARRIMSELSLVDQMMCESDQGNAAALIGRSLHVLCSVEDLDKGVGDLAGMLADIESLVNDFNRGLSSYMDSLDFDGQEYDETAKRLDIINGLKMKYAKTIETILEYRDEKEERLKELSDFDENKAELKDRLDLSSSKLHALCDELTAARTKAAGRLAKDIAGSLKELNFPDVRFEVRFEKKSTVNRTGADRICFMISTNPGEDPKPLSKIASGGEISRIMLAIKAALADKDEIESLIFDEIDTGISGRTAQKVADKMYGISDSHQIICITHLPQIASMADTHFLIEKKVSEDKTFTTIRRADEEESVLELARLLGGSSITDTVIANAREMRQTARRR